jgi:hypothetical protein
VKTPSPRTSGEFRDPVEDMHPFGARIGFLLIENAKVRFYLLETISDYRIVNIVAKNRALPLTSAAV